MREIAITTWLDVPVANEIAVEVFDGCNYVAGKHHGGTLGVVLQLNNFVKQISCIDGSYEISVVILAGVGTYP